MKKIFVTFATTCVLVILLFSIGAAPTDSKDISTDITELKKEVLSLKERVKSLEERNEPIIRLLKKPQ